MSTLAAAVSAVAGWLSIAGQHPLGHLVPGQTLPSRILSSRVRSVGSRLPLLSPVRLPDTTVAS